MSKKPTFYLWEQSNSKEERIKIQKKQLIENGFRVVIIKNSSARIHNNQDISAFLRNHNWGEDYL